MLIHSPLVGPATWASVANALGDDGIAVARPDLRDAVWAHRPMWQAAVDTALEGANDLGDEIIMVGHSGARAYLPLIGWGLSNRASALVFVDAVLPPTTGMHTPTDEVQSFLRGLAVGGVLPPWSTWWGDDAMAALISDDGLRRAIEVEMPRVPLARYAESVPVPDAWTRNRCGYVKLSSAYDAASDEARRRGWPTTSVAGTHLTLVTDPTVVVGAIQAIVTHIDLHGRDAS